MANVRRSSWLSIANNGACKQGTWPAFKGKDEASTGGPKQQGIDAGVDGHAHGINASLMARATRLKVAAAGEQSGLSTHVGDDPLTRSLPGGPWENTKSRALVRASTARLSALTRPHMGRECVGLPPFVFLGRTVGLGFRRPPVRLDT
jgi:hypothetical protein